MKKNLLKFVFLPAIICTLLVVGAFAVTDAHAAAAAPQMLPPTHVSRITCGYTQNQVSFETDYPRDDTVCFAGSGSLNVGLYNVFQLYTGIYTLHFNWIDCHGGTHSSVKGPKTFLKATTPGEFGGCNYLGKITFIALS